MVKEGTGLHHRPPLSIIHRELACRCHHRQKEILSGSGASELGSLFCFFSGGGGWSLGGVALRAFAKLGSVSDNESQFQGVPILRNTQ